MVALIWDIQAEHLDEAEFLLEMWAAGVDAPNVSLATLHGGTERRLLARVDGLLVGGDQSFTRLLAPSLGSRGSSGSWRCAAAALTVLTGGSTSACEAVLDLLRSGAGTAALRRGLVLAFGLSRRDGLVPWLGRELDTLAGPALVDVVEILATHRVNAGARLLPWLSSDQLALRRAAASLARHTGAPPVLRALELMMNAPDQQLRARAIDSGIIRGLGQAWAAACGAIAGPEGSFRRRAIAWVAMLGDAAAHAALLSALRAAPTPALLWAAGLSGRREAVELAVELLAHPTLGRLAGEVVCAVAGLSSEDEAMWLDRGRNVGVEANEALPPLQQDALDGALIPRADDHLRRPAAAPVRAWWRARRDQLDASQRYLGGHLLDLPHLARTLRTCPTRRRHPLALELAARSSGRAQLNTRGLTLTQHEQGEELFARLAFLDFQRGLPLAS